MALLAQARAVVRIVVSCMVRFGGDTGVSSECGCDMHKITELDVLCSL